MLEIEAKFRVGDFAAIEDRLRSAGARFLEDRRDTDRYYTVPGRDLKKTGEAFRLRRTGSANCLTYKGPRHPGPTKTRTEIEVPFAAGEGAAADLHRILAIAG